MAVTYHAGMHVRIRLRTRTGARKYTTPGTSIQVKIKDSAGAQALALATMTEDSEGRHYYDWPVSKADTFTVIFKTVHGGKTTYSTNTFTASADPTA